MAVATTGTGTPAPTVHGFVAPGFEPVREAFARNFAEHGEVGAACCIYRHGEPVVDIHAGLADRASGRPWRDDTLQLVFSATKGVTAACILLLVERGRSRLHAATRARPVGGSVGVRTSRRRRLARVRRSRARDRLRLRHEPHDARDHGRSARRRPGRRDLPRDQCLTSAPERARERCAARYSAANREV